MNKISLSKYGFSKEVSFLLLSIFLFSAALGIEIVVLQTALIKNFVDPTRIAIALVSEIVASIVASFFLSKIVAKFGMMKSLFVCATFYAIIISLIFLCSNFFICTSLIFILGGFWFSYIVIRQAWLNTVVENSKRSIIVGVSSTLISAGLALGPICVNLIGARSYWSFCLASIFIIASFISLIPIRKTAKIKINSQQLRLKTFFIKNPRCFAGRFLMDLQCYSMIAFTIIFGKKIGITEERAGLLISSYMLSGFLDFFVGFIIKKYSPYSLIKLGFAGCALCFIAVIFYHQSYIFLLAAYFVFGLFVACIFVSVTTLTNSDYKKSRLVSANSTFQKIGSIGALFGGILGAIAIKIFDASGFAFVIIFSSLSYLLFAFFYEKKNKTRSQY